GRPRRGRRPWPADAGWWRAAVLPPGDLRRHRAFDGWAPPVACRTPWAYTVTGAGGLGRSPTERRLSRRGASGPLDTPADAKASATARRCDGACREGGRAFFPHRRSPPWL